MRSRSRSNSHSRSQSRARGTSGFSFGEDNDERGRGWSRKAGEAYPVNPPSYQQEDGNPLSSPDFGGQSWETQGMNLNAAPGPSTSSRVGSSLGRIGRQERNDTLA